MSCPDPLYDYDDFDDQAERNIFPWCDDASYDTDDEAWYDESMDGDHDSAMESAGWGTDEDYGYYGEDY